MTKTPSGFMNKVKAQMRQEEINSLAKAIAYTYQSFSDVQEHSDWELFEMCLIKAEETWELLNDKLGD